MATGSKVCLLQPPPHLSGCRESQGLISLVPSEAKMGHRRKDAFPVSGGAALTRAVSLSVGRRPSASALPFPTVKGAPGHLAAEPRTFPSVPGTQAAS